MAAVTLLGTATFTTTAGSKTVTATPAVDDLMVIVTAHTGVTGADLPTDNQGGTYVLSSNKGGAAIFVRTAKFTSAVSTVFTHTPTGTTTGGGLVVLKVTGMTRVGTAAIFQAGGTGNPAAFIAGATPQCLFAATPQTTNPIIAAALNASNPAALTPRTGYTERFDNGYATPTTGLEVMSLDSGETSATITWGGTSVSAGNTVAVELDSSSGGTAHATTGALTGQGSSVTGSAAHIAIHGTSGALTGQLGSVAGSATRFRAHAASGTPTGQIGSLAATAARLRTFIATGSLVGQGSIVTGDASVPVMHAATGALVGSASAIEGIAQREARTNGPMLRARRRRRKIEDYGMIRR